MEKQPLGTQKIDNRLSELIERYPGVANRYVKEVQKYLKENGHPVYGKSLIWRLVTNRVALNPRNIIVKKALESVVESFEEDLQAA